MFGSDKRKFIATIVAIFLLAILIAVLNAWHRGLL